MKQFFLGFIFVIFGVLFLLGNMEIIPYNMKEIISIYWPALIIFWGLHEFHDEIIFKGRRSFSNYFFPTLLIIVGSVLLGNNLKLFPNGPVNIWQVLWPLTIIFFGLSFIFPSRLRKTKVHIINDNSKKRSHSSSKFNNHTNNASKNVFVGSFEVGKEPWVLEDSNYHVGVGEAKINLSKAYIKEGETHLDVSGCTGSITIILPEDVAVNINAYLDLGSLTLFREEHSGTPGHVTYKSLDYDNSYKKLTIYVKLNIGEIIIKQVD